MKQPVIIFFVNVFSLLELLSNVSGTNMCYQCDTWENMNCAEDEHLPDKYIVPCGWRGQTTPTSCLKETTTFSPGQFAAQLDPQNKYGRPHVIRRCGLSVIPNYKIEDYDKCVDTEVLVDNIQGIRRVCSCTTVGCNGNNFNATSESPTKPFSNAELELQETTLKLNSTQSMLKEVEFNLNEKLSQLNWTEEQLNDVQSKINETQSKLVNLESKLKETQDKLISIQSELIAVMESKLTDAVEKLSKFQSQIILTESKLTEMAEKLNTAMTHTINKNTSGILNETELMELKM